MHGIIDSARTLVERHASPLLDGHLRNLAKNAEARELCLEHARNH